MMTPSPRIALDARGGVRPLPDYRALPMGWFAAPEAEVARWILQHGTALVYLLAFVSTARQFPALLGERGLLPVPRLLERAAGLGPPVFSRVRYTDRRLLALCWIGGAVAALLVLGLPQLG